MNNLKTPIAQTVIMGSVFFFTFSAYLTIQAFASDMYGETLGSNMATSLCASPSAAPPQPLGAIECSPAPSTPLRPPQTFPSRSPASSPPL